MASYDAEDEEDKRVLKTMNVTSKQPFSLF